MNSEELGGRRVFVQGRIPSQWLVEQMPEALWATDGALRFVVVGGTGARALGLDPDKVLGTSVYDYFRTTDPTYPPLAAHLRALQGREETYRFEYGGRVFSVRVGPVRHAIGRVVGVVACATDVTALVAAAEQMAFRATLEAIPLCVIRLDQQLRVTFANRAARHAVGMEELEARGLVEVPALAAFEEAVRRAWHLGETGSVESCVGGQDGRVYRWSAAPELDPEGNRRGVVVVGWDATDTVRELRSVQQQSTRWEAWAGAAQGLLQAQDLAQLAEVLLQGARELGGARHGGVALWEAGSARPTVERLAGAVSQPHWERLREQASVGEALWLDPSDPEEATLVGFTSRSPRRALVVPVRGQEAGGVVLLAWEQEDPEPSEDAGLLVRLARMAAGVASARVQEQGALRYREFLERCHRLWLRTGQASDLSEAVDRWLWALVDTLGASGAALYRQEGDVWVRLRHVGERHPAATFGGDEGAASEVAQTGQMRVLRPARGDPAFVGYGLEGAVVPLLNSHRACVLAVESAPDRGFSPDDLRLLEAAAPQLEGVVRWYDHAAAQLAELDRYRHLVDAAPVGVLVLDGSRVVRYANVAAGQMLDRPPEELPGKSLMDLVHPEDRTELAVALSRVYADRHSQPSWTMRLVRRDGAGLWVEAVASNRMDDPRLAGVLVALRDVTAQREAQQSSAARVEDLEAIRDLSVALRGCAPAELARTVVRKVATSMRADHAALVLWDPDGESFTVVAVHGLLAELEGNSFPAAGVYAHVMTTGDVFRSEEVPEDPVLTSGHGLGPLLVVPVRTSQRTLGALGLARVAGSPLGPFEAREAARALALGEVAADYLDRLEAVGALERAYVEVVLSLARAMDAHDGVGPGHGAVVAHWAELVAQRMGCSPAQVREIRWAALLHNVGKVGIPEEVLRKSGPLTADELALVQRYPVLGEQILEAVPRFRGVARLVRHHRERWDGTGYPDGLRGEEIPLGSRIIAVVDAYNAMTDHRRYRVVRGHAEAVAELQRHAGSQFDPQVVRVFLELLKEERSL